MSSNLKPTMAYLTFDQHIRLKRFATKHNVAMAQVIRESIDARIASGDRYSHGYNTGLRDAMRVVEDNKAARMRFPSGKSFAELVNADIKKLEINREEKQVVTKEHAATSAAGSAGGEGQTDSDLGV